MPDEKKPRIKKTGTYHVVTPDFNFGLGYDTQVIAESFAKAECKTGDTLIVIRKVKSISKKEITKVKFEEN